MRKKNLKKGIFREKPKPIVIKCDPADFKTGITVPVIKYEVTASIGFEETFSGRVLPIPRVLISYLNHAELLIVSLILEETIEWGESVSTITELSKKLKISGPTVSNNLYKLRKMGLLTEQPNGYRGAGKTRKLNFKAIQHLNDLVEGENSDVFPRIRKATRKIDLLNLTKEDILKGYDNHVLPIGHDPAEEEEYD